MFYQWRPRADQTRKSRPVWLLDIEWAGRTWRVASESVTLTDRNSDDHPYSGGLVMESFTEEIDPDNVTPSASSASVQVYLNTPIKDLWKAGYDPQSAAGKLWMVLVDAQGTPLQTMEQRWFVVDGPLVGAQWGAKDKPSGWMLATIRGETWEARGLMLDAGGIVTTTSWPSAHEDSINKVYPDVMGVPGNYKTDGATGASAITPGSPAYIIEWSGTTADKLLIAGHAVASSDVWIWDQTRLAQTFSVDHEVDGNGRLCAVVDTSTPGAIDNTDTEYWVSWGGTAPDKGGRNSLFGNGTLEGLGEAAIWGLTRGGADADYARWLAINDIMPHWVLGTYHNDTEKTGSDWVLQEVLEYAPIAIRSGPRGWYPLITDPELAEQAAIINITAGPGFTSVGPIQLERDVSSLVTGVEVSWAYDQMENEANRSTIIGSIEAGDTHANIWSEMATIAGQRVLETISLPQVYDQASAVSIAASKLRRACTSRWSMAYHASPQWGWLVAGDWFRLTDSERSFTTQPVQIVNRQWTGAGWTFGILYHDTIRMRPA